MNLIFTYVLAGGYEYSPSLRVFPLEYESPEVWVLELEKHFEAMVKDPNYKFDLPGTQVELERADFDWTFYEEGDKYKLITTFEQFFEVNDMQIAELDTWFEHKKGTEI
jgi:hypothetical protein